MQGFVRAMNPTMDLSGCKTNMREHDKLNTLLGVSTTAVVEYLTTIMNS